MLFINMNKQRFLIITSKDNVCIYGSYSEFVLNHKYIYEFLRFIISQNKNSQVHNS